MARVSAIFVARDGCGSHLVYQIKLEQLSRTKTRENRDVQY